MEDAAPEVEAVIARRMNDIWDSNTFTHVLGTTAMYRQVSEKLRDCFAVTDLEVGLVIYKFIISHNNDLGEHSITQ